MPESRPFTVHANLGPRFVGLILLSVCGAVLASILLSGGDPAPFGKVLIRMPIAMPFGTFLILTVSSVRVDPRAETLTRRKGTWPFVRETRYAFCEVDDLLEDTVTSSKGRTYNQLRVRFVDGAEWELLAEFHKGTRVRALGERLSETTGVLLTSG